MPKVYIKGKSNGSSRTKDSEATLANVRIDPAHVISAEPETPLVAVPVEKPEVVPTATKELVDGDSQLPLSSGTVESLDAAAGRNLVAAQEQLQIQSAQLAAFLRNKQQELDQREARLNALDSELEMKSRATRLGRNERNQEIQQREIELQQRASELEQRAAAIALAEMDGNRDRVELQQQMKRQAEELFARSQECDAKQKQMEKERAELSEAQHRFQQMRKQTDEAWVTEKESAELTIKQLLSNIERERAALDEREKIISSATSSKCSELRQIVDAENRDKSLALQARETQLEKLESICQEQWNACENERRQVETLRRKFEEESLAERTELLELRRVTEFELEATRDDIARREEDLDRHRTAVEQLHTVVSKQHHEALELRLVTEQVWAQLAGRQNAVELTKSVAVLRHQLADEFRMAHESVAEQQQELRRLSERLDEQQTALRKQRSDLQDWVGRRHEEIEEQAARLVAREQELDQQQRFYDGQKSQHDSERRVLQKQIRDLMAQIRPGELVSTN